MHLPIFSYNIFIVLFLCFYFYCTWNLFWVAYPSTHPGLVSTSPFSWHCFGQGFWWFLCCWIKKTGLQPCFAWLLSSICQHWAHLIFKYYPPKTSGQHSVLDFPSPPGPSLVSFVKSSSSSKALKAGISQGSVSNFFLCLSLGDSSFI